MLLQDLHTLVVGAVDESLDLVINIAGRAVGIGLGLGIAHAHENFAVVVIVADRAHLFAHAVFGYHLMGNGSGLLDVRGCAGGDVLHAKLLCHAAAQGGHDALVHFVAAVAVLVLVGQVQGQTAGLSSGNDGDLLHRVMGGQIVGRHRVSGLVIGREPAGMLRNLAALFLGACPDLEHGFLQIGHGNAGAVGTGCQKRRFVEQVFQLRARKAHRCPRHRVQIYGVGQRLVLGVYLEDGLSAAAVRRADVDLAVKPARAQQRRVKDVFPVGGRHDDDAVIAGKAVHLHQKLVEGLLPLVVTAAQTCTSAPAYGVDLVDKDNGRRHFLGLIKQVADTARAHAHIQLHKIGAGNGEELYLRLTGYGLGNKGLAGARRAYQQNATGHLGAQTGIFVRIPQEFHNLLQLRLFLLRAGHVVKGHRAVAFAHTDVGLAELHHIATAAVGTVGNEDQRHDDYQCQHQRRQVHHPPGRGRVRLIVVGFQHTVGVLLLHQLVHVRIEHGEIRQGIVQLGFALIGALQLHMQHVVPGGEALDLLILEQREHLRILQLHGILGGEQLHHAEQKNTQDQGVENDRSQFRLFFQRFTPYFPP